jgi:hypothetical protein
VVMPRSENLDPWFLHASCLAARMPDRPCSLAIATGSPEELRRAVGVALASGMGLVVLSPQGGSGAMERSEDEVLKELASFVRDLPSEMEEPVPARARSLLFREHPGGPVSGDQRRNVDIALPSLLLLHRLGFERCSFLFEEQRSEPAPEFLHVPAQGPLEEEQWMRLQLLGNAGCRVLITGLCLGDESTRDRLEALGVAPKPLAPSEMPSYAHWMRFRSILDTGHRVVSVTVGQGVLAFLDRPPESQPEDPRTIPGIEELIPEDLQSTLTGPDLAECRIGLDMPSCALRYDIESGHVEFRED